MSDVREILKKRPLLFDGGMGTYYKAKPGQECEQANLLDPEGVLAVHGAYLEAGADAIKTNTFGLPRMAEAGNPLWEALTDEGWKLRWCRRAGMRRNRLQPRPVRQCSQTSALLRIPKLSPGCAAVPESRRLLH